LGDSLLEHICKRNTLSKESKMLHLKAHKVNVSNFINLGTWFQFFIFQVFHFQSYNYFFELFDLRNNTMSYKSFLTLQLEFMNISVPCTYSTTTLCVTKIRRNFVFTKLIRISMWVKNGIWSCRVYVWEMILFPS